MSALLFLLLAALSIDQQDYASEDGLEYLSLRPTHSATRGTAWYVKRTYERELFAFTGPYELDESGPLPAIRLYLSRKWNFEQDLSSTGRNWRFDYDYYSQRDLRYGAHGEYDGSAGDWDLSVMRAVAIDGKGTPLSRDTYPTTFSHFTPKRVMSFKPGPMPQDVRLHPPPGYVERSLFKNRQKTSPSSVSGAGALAKDFYGWSLDAQTFLVLSLQADKKWDEGEARLLRAKFPWTGKEEYLVARGRFKVTLAGELDTLVLNLPMTRYYTLEAWDGLAQWQSHDTSGGPTGLTLYMPLDDRQIRPESTSLYVERASYVDEQGRTQRRYNDDGGLLRSPTERTVSGAFGVGVGTTFTMRVGMLPGDGRPGREKQVIDEVARNPPLGFRLRPLAERHVVAKAMAPQRALDVLTPRELVKYAADAQHRGDYAGSSAVYKKLLKDHAAVMDEKAWNGAAWLWATCPDASVRDGALAWEAAYHACQLTQWREGWYLDTLAAAYAECGDFGNAVLCQERAQPALKGAEQEAGKRRLEGYRRGQPYREPRVNR